jgi:toxin CcdB
MAQLDVYVNPEEESRGDVPFLLDIQHDMHFQLRTRMVVPLVRSELQRAGISALCPIFTIQGRTVFASIPEMASFPARELDQKVVNLSDRRDEIFAALDLLLHGF